MAITQNNYTGNGSTVLYSFTFPYLDPSDIKIEVNGTLTTAYTLANATTIQFNTAPANGATIRIYRDTAIEQLSATFFPGSAIRADDLNDDFTQTLYKSQELESLVEPLASLQGTYFGAYASNPTVDPFGNPLTPGDLYFNTTLDQMRVFNGTSWQEASADATITRFKFTAAGGETSLSGADDSAKVLTYNVGLELVYLNGALLTRGVDYTATNGTSITGLVALTAADLVEVVAFSQINALNSIPGANIADGTITEAKLASGAVTSAKIADGTITEAKLASGAVTSAKIADGTIVNADVNASAGIVSTKLSFTQAGTGAVARTVDSKLKEIVSPLDFGAAGNSNAAGSVGTNDSAAFALLEAAHTNKVVNLEGKYYLVNSPIPAANNYINGKFVVVPATTYDQPNSLALGFGALKSNTYVPKQWPAGGGIDYASGNYNTAFGDGALFSNTTGRRNTAVGSQTLYTNTSGYYNTAVGSFALYTNVTGNYNTALGNQALQYSTGSNNAAFGSGALTSLTIGDDNIAIGDRAMGISAQVNRTIAIGTQAGQQHTGNDSIAIGYQALSAPSSSGLYNVAMGSAALGSATTANSTVAVGRRAAAALTTGAGNTAIGTDAMVGSGAACTGSNNVAIGNTASPNITSGYQNVSVGPNAGTALGSGFNNTLVGRYAGQSINSGAGNIAIGEQSLSATTTGNYNTAVGTGTVGNAADTNTTMLGYQATVTGSNQVQLGNSNTTTYVYGTVQNRSDERDKADIQDTILGLEFINSLRPVDFKWDYREDYEGEKDGSKKRIRFHHGLIAQEVKQVCDGLGIDFGGYQDHSVNGGKDVLTLGYDELIAPLIKAVQQLSAEVEQLKAQLP